VFALIVSECCVFLDKNQGTRVIVFRTFEEEKTVTSCVSMCWRGRMGNNLPSKVGKFILQTPTRLNLAMEKQCFPSAAKDARCSMKARRNDNVDTSSPESVATVEQSVVAQAVIEKLSLDVNLDSFDVMKSGRIQIDSPQLLDEKYTRMFIPIRSESEWNGFGVDASFLEDNQHFATRRHRDELLLSTA